MLVKKGERLLRQCDVIRELEKLGKKVTTAYFSKSLREGRIPFHRKEGQKNRRFYYLSEVKPFFLKDDVNIQKTNKSKSIKKIVKTTENENELEKLLEFATTPIQKVQIAKEFWVGKINQHKYEVEKKLYYPKQEIDEKVGRIITNAKNKALALPTKLAPQLIGLEDINEIKSILEDGIYEFLNEVARLGDELV